MHIEPRGYDSIDRIYLHTNEGPQGPNAAFNLGQYLDRIDAGYHVIVDDAHTIVKAADSQVVWAEGGDNHHALSICMIGYSATNDWNSAYSKAMVERAAQQASKWAATYNIPQIHVAPGLPGQAPTQRGIAEHADDHSPASQGHTDPGANFNINGFVTRVHNLVSPPIDWAAIQKLLDWQKRVALHPLKLGMNSPDVYTMNALLNKKGYLGVIGSGYGVKSATAVAHYKASQHWRNTDGTYFGGPIANRILGLS